MSLDGTPGLAVIGLGYVGVQLAVAFGTKRRTLGYDLTRSRVEDLKAGRDSTLTVTPEELLEAQHLRLTYNGEDLLGCNVFVVAVPTPIEKDGHPSLAQVVAATLLIGKLLPRKGLVVYESTVYPGATEDVCIPLLEKTSGLKADVDFYVGYSPERINPGDRGRRLSDVVKVTSGSGEAAADAVDALYRSVVTAGTHRASSIRVAECAKLVENIQRDVNIALVNEVAMVCGALALDVQDVLAAARSKWNFLPFHPGLVGGPCLGAAAPLLSQAAVRHGFNPSLLQTARNVNNSMPAYVADSVVQAMARQDMAPADAKVLILGAAFKENSTDWRNSKITPLVQRLKEHGCRVEVFDPLVTAPEAFDLWSPFLRRLPARDAYDAVILAVPHDYFVEMGRARVAEFGKRSAPVIDITGVFRDKGNQASESTS